MAQVAKNLSDKPRVKQVKTSYGVFPTSETQSIEAGGEVKATADTHDKYLVYSNFPKVEQKAFKGVKNFKANGRAAHINGLFIKRFTTGR